MNSPPWWPPGGMGYAPDFNPFNADCEGQLPRGQGTKVPHPIALGEGSSSANVVVLPTNTIDNQAGLMSIRAPDTFREGCEGLATIHVMVDDETPTGLANPNDMLRLAVGWQSGRAGGTALVDAANGTMFTVSGTQAISISAFFVSAVLGDALVVFSSKRVRMNVHWEQSANPKPAFLTDPAVDAAAIAPFVFTVPKQARIFRATSNSAVAATVAAIRADFHTSPAGGSLRYSHLNPVNVPIPVVAGVRGLVIAGPAQIVHPVWELWL